MSAFVGKADISDALLQCLLMTQSGRRRTCAVKLSSWSSVKPFRSQARLGWLW
jgi:hypothetical protein